jgi:uncharacterized membrane-anchored protein
MDRPIPPQQLDPNTRARGTAAEPWNRTLRLARKVPEITILFWIAKLLTTAMGEATSDYLVFGINKYVAVVVGCVALIVALILQLSVPRYIAWVYWLAVAMVAVFGTMAADVLHLVILAPRLDPVLGVGRSYLVSALFFAICLAVVFVWWYATERTLSIHTINTRRRELFYWATVIATFALGTAAGDMTAFTLGLGFFTSAMLFYVLIALPALGYFLLGLNEVAAFWIAYVLTRPLGASIADWFGKSKSLTGLGLGDSLVSVVLTVLIVLLVGYLTISGKDTPKDTARDAVR